MTTWRCPRCGEVMEVQFDTCWNCGEMQPGLPKDEDLAEQPPPPAADSGSSCGCMGQVLGPSLETMQPENAPSGGDQSQLDDSENEFRESDDASYLPMVIAAIAVLVMLWLYGG
jgi:hypothetical protein